MNQIAPLPDARLANTWLDGAKRIGRLLLLALAVVASLLTFPAGIVWMSACWFAAYSMAVVRKNRASWFLVAWAAIIVTKRIDWPAGLWFLMCGVALTVTASLLGWRGKRFWAASCPPAIWCGWIAFAISSHQAGHLSRSPPTPQGRSIVCLGDSLTSYTRDGGYPEVLAEMVSLPVINLGQPGITSAAALKKLPEMKAARPAVVVIELGGHDFLKDESLLKRASRAAVKRNLETIIAAARTLGAEVVLMEVPRGFIVDPYAGLERELAREHDLELIPDTTIRRFVLFSPVAPPGMWLGGPYLSDDGLHPNSRGNALLAQRVLTALERLYCGRLSYVARPGMRPRHRRPPLGVR
ncbi:MAG TPA: GDSL-type esterase/lipase family protein [Pirellulales bacterium]